MAIGRRDRKHTSSANQVIPGQRTRVSRLELIVGGIVLLAIWEVAAHYLSATSPSAQNILPTWESVLTRSTLDVSNYWTASWGPPAPEQGGDQTYLGGLFALAYGGGITLLRALIGFAIGGSIGIGLGLACSASRPLMLLTFGGVNFFRMVPLLAMVPLFALWFGGRVWAAPLFIAYGVFVLAFVAVVEAIRNVPAVLVEYARTLGCKENYIYRRVVLPAAVPEIRNAMLAVLAVVWSLALAAEYLGANTGLGWIMKQSLQFSRVGTMVLVSLVFVLMAAVVLRAFGGATKRWVSWKV